MKEKKDGILAYGILLLCLSFTLGYLLGHANGETEIQVTPGVSASVEVTEESTSVAETVDTAATADTERVNLNTASRSELEQLPGIGPELASRIIAYRAEHGSFVSKEQIMDVKGIGEKKFADLEHLITVGGSQ